MLAFIATTLSSHKDGNLIIFGERYIESLDERKLSW